MMGATNRTLYRTRLETWSRVDPIQNGWDLHDFAGAESNNEAVIVTTARVTDEIRPEDNLITLVASPDRPAIAELRDGD